MNINENNFSKSILTGFNDLDSAINGLNNGSLTIVASRPAMGKTTLALNIAEYVSITEKIPVLIFNLELSKDECIKRILVSRALVENQKIIDSNLNDDEWNKIKKATDKLSNAEIYIDDTSNIEIEYIVEKSKKLKLEKNIGLIVIDYLQLIKHDANDEEIGKILKLLAEEINVPIIITSQLARNSKNETLTRPTIEDFNYSKGIVECADTIILLYRDNFDCEDKNITELIIAKNKYGNSNNTTIKLLFLDDYMKFANVNGAEK